MTRILPEGEAMLCACCGKPVDAPGPDSALAATCPACAEAATRSSAPRPSVVQPDPALEVTRQFADAPTQLAGPAAPAAAPHDPEATPRVAPPLHPRPAVPAAAAPAPLPGTPFGRYRLLKQIGVGGMGAVWTAWDGELRRTVALKQIKPEETDTEGAVARFLREARLAAKLRHPAIVAVHDVGAVDGRHYITMDYVAGRTLKAWLADTREAKRTGTGPAPERLRAEVRLLAAVADAVGYAHREGVVHRDLKPSNVLLDDSDRPFVVDFGLAKEVTAAAGETPEAAATRVTLSGTSLGTPQYMAPEQATGDLSDIGPRSDVWALGVILYEVLTGRRPYEVKSPLELILALEAEDPPLPHSLQRAAPPDLEAVCLKALEKAPAARYANAEEFAAELARWLAAEPVQAVRPTRVARARRWLARRRAAAAASALFLCLLALALGLVWGERRQRAQRTHAALDQIAAAVAKFEDAQMKTEMPPETLQQYAQQPLGLLERLIADDPRCGAAWSWRGRVREILLDRVAAEADYVHGCELSPDQAVVWLLRGLYRTGKYARGRRDRIVFSGGETRIVPLADGTAEERAARADGLADLERAAGLGVQDGSTPGDEARLGKALVALCSGQPAGIAETLALLRGVAGPRAARFRGQAFLALQRLDEARAALDEAIAEWPLDPDARFFHGLVLIAAGGAREARGEDGREEFRRAAEDFTTALRREPGYASALENRGIARERLGDAEAGRGLDPRPSYREAIADLRACVKQAGEFAATANNCAILLHALGDADEARGSDPRASYRQAIEQFDAALRADPGLVPAYANRGNAASRLADAQAARAEDPRPTYERALADYDEALRREPGFAEAWQNRGTLRMRLGDALRTRGEDPRPQYERALADFERALALAHDTADVYSNRGTVHARLGAAREARGEDPADDLNHAIADFGAALAKNPRHAGALANRGAVWHQIGDAESARGRDPRPWYQKAIADDDRVLELNPERGESYANRAAAWRAVARADAAQGVDPRPAFARALADYDAAVQRKPREFGFVMGRGQTAYALGELEEGIGLDPRPSFRRALSDFDVAVDLQPATALPLACRGDLHTSLGEAEAERGEDATTSYRHALADYETAFRLDPTLHAANVNRGTVRLKLAEAEAARGLDPRATYRQGIATLDEVLQRDPRDTKAWIDRGTGYLKLGDEERSRGSDPRANFVQAEADFQEAVRRGDGRAHFLLGVLYRELGRREDAVQAFEASARVDAGHAAEARRQVEELGGQAGGGLAQSFDRAMALLHAGDYAAAQAGFEGWLAQVDAAVRALPEKERAARLEEPTLKQARAIAHYNLACIESVSSAGKSGPTAAPAVIDAATRTAHRERAFAHLEEALHLGFPAVEEMKTDKDLESIRDDPRFGKLLDRPR